VGLSHVAPDFRQGSLPGRCSSLQPRRGIHFHPDDIDELVAEELVNDRPVIRLLYRAAPGDNKDLSRYPPEWVAAEQANKGD